MVNGIIKTKVTASDNNNAKKIGAVLKNIASTVSENDLLKIYDIIKDKPTFFSDVVSKLDKPIIKTVLGLK